MKLVSEKLNRAVGCFFDFEEEVVACVSGGADSMALLGCLINCGKNLKIVVAHFNHKLRGNESDEDENFVRNWCDLKGIGFICRRVDIAKIAETSKKSVEMAGREERYRFFNEFGKTIVTAHTLSDRVETLLFNLARGASLKGLCSIPSVRCNVKRPLLCFSRGEIEDYCKENGLPFRTDSSNFCLEYSRNRIRHKIVSEFKFINEKFEFNVLRTILCLKHDDSYFSSVVDEFLKDNFNEGKLYFSSLNLQHWSIKSRIIVEFLKLNKIEATYGLVERILKLVNKGSFKINVSGERVLKFCRGFLSVENKKLLLANKFDFILPNTIKTSYKNLTFIRTKIVLFNYFFCKKPHLFLFKFDYDKIRGLVHIRSRVDGDKIKLLNRPTKKLKSLMQESKIPIEERDNIVVLSDDLGPFWICGFGGSERVLVDDRTENLVLVFKEV